MKILKCVAENFGTLSKFKMDFKDGLNTVIHENGWGKSTLAAFVKAMFYGMPQSNGAKLQKNERQRYMPWQGGRFGGNLEFEYQGKQYRIERFFGSKQSEDTFKLIDLKTGKDSKAFSSRVGDEIFGIDSEAYERSTYLPQKNIEFAANTSISAKLSKLVEDTDDINNFDSAINAIDNRIKYFKKTGNKGRIADLEREIIDLSAKIDSCHVAIKTSDDLKVQREKDEQELERLRKQLTEVKQQLSTANKSASAAHYVSLKNNLDNIQREFESISKRFDGNTPEQSIIDKHIASANSLNKTDSLIESLNNSRDRIYSDCNNDDGKQVETCLNKAKQLAARSETTVAATPKTTDKKSKILIGIMAAAAVLLGAGIVLSIVGQLIAGLVLVGIGIIVGGVSVLLFFQTPKSSDTTNKQTDKEIKAEIESFLSRFTLPPFNDYFEKLYEVKSGIENSLKIQSQINTLTSERQTLRDSLETFLTEYGYTTHENYTESLYDLKNVTTKFSSLKDEIPNQQRQLEAFVKNNNIDVSSIVLTSMPSEISTLEETENRLTTRIDSLHANMIHTEHRIEAQLKIAENLDDLENRLVSVRDEKTDAERKLLTLEYAKKFIFEAKETLSTKYLTDMKSGFTKYFNLLDGNDIEAFDMDTDLNIRIIAAGESKDIDYFSTGSRDLIGFCTRFALIDAMFKAEKPFIILDDPFINLDDRRTECAIKLIEKIASEFQIVYLVCNTSRIA